MINSINPNNLYSHSACTPQASAVNIQIFNPQAFASPDCNPNYWNTIPTTPYPPINTPVYNNLNPNVVQPPVENPVKAPVENPIQNPQLNQPYMAPNGGENAAGIDNASNLKSNPNLSSKNDAEAKNASGEKPKVVLSDEYIKNLENYLNSQDPRVRLMGAKELLERFKEDNSRAGDKALNALLNKTIQDPNNTVKFVGLTILDSGYSKGNDETISILKNIQQDTSAQYGEDSLLASQILLKMSGQNAS